MDQLHYCPDTGLYWTADQLIMAEDGDLREPLAGNAVLAHTLDDLGDVTGHATVEDLELVMGVIMGSPPGLLVAIRDEHMSASYCWSGHLFDARAIGVGDGPEDARLHSLPTQGLEELSDALGSFIAGYTAGLRNALASEIALARESERPRIFADMVALDPEWAVRCLERGVCWRGGTLDLRSALRPVDVAALLQHTDRTVRERVLGALPKPARRGMRRG